MLKIRFLWICYLLNILSSVVAQEQATEPIISNYAPAEYTLFINDLPDLDNNTKQSVKSLLASAWATTQASNGKIYFATAGGILEFDGQRWDIIFVMKTAISNATEIRSIRYDKHSDKVYVGCKTEFGYLEKQPNGKTKYVSLYDKYKDKIQKVLQKEVGEIWSIQVHNRDIYFHSRWGVFVYNGKDIRILPTQDSYHRLFVADQQIYVRQENIGLTKLDDNNFVPIKYGELFAHSPNFQISGLLTHYKEGLLIGTRREGLFYYNKYSENQADAFHKKGISPALDAQLKEAQIYHMRVLADGKIAVGTLRDGLFILDRDLNLLHHLNENNGLQANSILSIFQDKDNYIWLTTFKGIVKIELNTPLKKWDARHNVNMRFNQITRYQNEMYGTCNIGLLKLDNKTNVFQLVAGIASQAWSVGALELDDKERLFVGADNLYELVEGRLVALLKLSGRTIITGVFNIPSEPNILYCTSNHEKILKLEYKAGKAILLETITMPIDINQANIYFIDNQANAWIGNPQNKENNILYLYSFKTKKIIHSYSKKDFPQFPKLGEKERLNILITLDFEGNIVVVFNMTGEAYLYNEAKNTFSIAPKYRKKYGLADSTFFNFLGDAQERAAMIAYPKDNLWQLFVRPVGKHTYQIDSIPNKFFFENGYAFMYFDDKNQEAWFSGQETLYKHNLKIKQKYNAHFPAYIRHAQPIHNPDSLYVYDVFGSNPKAYWQLPYKQNALRFEFSAVDFSSKDKVKFRYFLENNDATWSDWTTETYKEYTNLPEGTYTLHLQAMNHYGFIGQTTTFTFTVLAPWYRTWWAYSAYALLASLVIYVLVYLNMRRLRQQNEYLAQLVKERTLEIEDQKDEILAQSEELKQSNEEISAQKEEIEAQRDLVEKQNHELMDSITYGSRIQAAMLPFKEKITQTLTDYFILFQPRDVVSGDFYWFYDTHPQTSTAGKAVIVVADCTGHGVPGAFMSMIANQILYEVIIKKQLLEANDILHELHLEVRRSLRQYETDNRDGMDIGLVVLDKVNQTLEFAGAKNNMVYFQHDGLHIIKGDKHAIGGEQREIDRIFTKHSIDFQKEPITFYLYSDGYQDQFGGKDCKKFSPKRFRDLLTEIQSLDMEAQENVLRDTIIHWRSEAHERQTDDILIWGARLQA